MNEMTSNSEATERSRVSLVFLLGVIALAGFFWTALDRILHVIFLQAAISRRDDVEFPHDLLGWAIPWNVTKIVVVTLLLVLWIAFGQRLRRTHPRVTLLLVAVAVLLHFVPQLLTVYVALVHGVS